MSDCDESTSFLLPQVELHRHLEGSIRFETLIDEYRKQNIGFKTSVIGEYEKIFNSNCEQEGVDIVRKYLSEDEKMIKYWKSLFLAETQITDLTGFLMKFSHTQKLISSEEFIEKITFEACEDSYNDGTRILELRYSPQYIQKGHDLSFEVIHNAILRGIQNARDKYDIRVGLLGILDRSLSVLSASETTDFILQNKSTFVALDLANDELLFESTPFNELFRHAKRSGLNITVHAGEALERKFAKNVKLAIDDLGAQRIGHGVGIITDDTILEYVKEKGVLLEVCPSSNYLIKVVPSISEHPIKKLIDRGVKVSISSDDPGLFNISLKHEYDVLKKELNFTQKDIDNCNRLGFEASFLPSDEKLEVVKSLQRKLLSEL